MPLLTHMHVCPLYNEPAQQICCRYASSLVLTSPLQVMIAATEQGWNSSGSAGAAYAAGNICAAHNVASTNANVVFVTHVRSRHV